MATPSGFIKIRPRVNFSLSNFQRYLLDTIAQQMDERLRPHRPYIREYVKDYVYKYIIDSPEADALRTDQRLALDFGIQRGTENSIIQKIAEAVKNTVRVYFTTIKRKGNSIVGRVRITAIKGDYSDVLGLDGVSYQSDPSGIEIPWLKWLLTEGDRILNADFGVLDVRYAKSRSGGAIMLPLARGLKRAFRVDPRYAGTEDDNWLTRAVRDSRIDISNLVASYIV